MWLAGSTHTVTGSLDAVPRLIAQAHLHASICNVVSLMASVGGHGPHESSVSVLNVAICNGVQHITAWHRIGCRGREVGVLFIILLASVVLLSCGSYTGRMVLFHSSVRQPGSSFHWVLPTQNQHYSCRRPHQCIVWGLETSPGHLLCL